jgi:predicted peptidase
MPRTALCLFAALAASTGTAAAQGVRGADTLPRTPGIHELSLDLPGTGPVLFGVSVPRGYDAARPAPLVVVLHSGGEPMRHYGAAFMRLLVEPALRDLGPIMVAPDCPERAWSEPFCDRAVLAVVAVAKEHYAIDTTRVLVTGFSMGGRGAWFHAARHADIFTAAIPMAASTGGLSEVELATQPTYVIHSRADEVVPFEPAERNARALERAGRTIRFEGLWDYTHFEMYRYVDALKRGGRWVAERWNAAR